MNIQKCIQEGDVIILRNVFLERIWPGYWSHTGLYVGNNMVLQARAQGTHLIDMHEFLSAERALVLRPKLTKEMVRTSVELAMSWLGRPFDFFFDFTDEKRLSCIELVYQAYKEPLGLKPHCLLHHPVFLTDDLLSHDFKIIFDTYKDCSPQRQKRRRAR